jgi:serine/threonine-protein kinase
VADLSGKIIDDRYQLISELAAGGMASIYSALDTRLDRKVAVKIMHPHLANDEVYVERFIREAKSAALLSHPNIVAIQDQGWNTGGEPAVFIVMELIEGFTLRDLLVARGKLEPAEAFSYILPVLNALAAAHKVGIVHRDIKPENILISKDGRVKVADFGLAKDGSITGNLTVESSVVLGSVSYLSPEQIDRGVSDHRSDLYATGIVLFEMLTGSKPFTDTTPLRVALKHIHEEFPLPSTLNSNISPELDNIILKSVAKNPDDRYQTAAEMIEAIESYWQKIDPRHSQMSLELDVPRYLVNARKKKTKSQPTNAPTIALPSTKIKESEKKMAAKKTAKTGFTFKQFIVLIIIVGFVGGGYLYLSSSKKVERVPLTIVGESLSQAKIDLANVGNTNLVINKVQSSIVASGDVIDVNPSQGTQISSNTKITLTVSTGGNAVSIPLVVNSSPADATTTLAGAGFVISGTTKAFSSNVPKGLVIDTNPPGGSSVSPGTQVKLIISKGIDPNAPANPNATTNSSAATNTTSAGANSGPITIKNYVGKSADQALNELQAAGLQPTTITQSSNSIPAGLVISQNPDGSAPVAAGSTVQLVVSSGAPITIPNVYSLTLAKAKAIMEQAGFTVAVKGNNAANGIVIGVSPDSGNTATAGSVITLTVK